MNVSLSVDSSYTAVHALHGIFTEAEHLIILVAVSVAMLVCTQWLHQTLSIGDFQHHLEFGMHDGCIALHHHMHEHLSAHGTMPEHGCNVEISLSGKSRLP